MDGYILVVEDNADLNELFTRRLTKAGFTVRSAASVEDGIAVLAAEPHAPLLIVLDLSLPDGNGTDLLPLLDAPKYQRTKVLVVSAKAFTPEDGLAGYTVDQVIVKPVSPKHLVMLAHNLIGN